MLAENLFNHVLISSELLIDGKNSIYLSCLQHSHGAAKLSIIINFPWLISIRLWLFFNS